MTFGSGEGVGCGVGVGAGIGQGARLAPGEAAGDGCADGSELVGVEPGTAVAGAAEGSGVWPSAGRAPKASTRMARAESAPASNRPERARDGPDRPISRGSSSADRVVPSRMPRVTPRDPLHAHPAPLKEAITIDGLFCVARAAWLIAATRRQPEEDCPVKVDEADSKLLQFVLVVFVSAFSRPADVISRVRTVSRSRWASVAAAGRVTRSTSHPGAMSGPSLRRMVRNRRLTRLRTTAGPTRRPVEIPNRVRSRPFLR